MAEPSVTPVVKSDRDKFRDTFKEAAIVVAKLSTLCKTTDELVEVLNLAQTNDAQLELLIDRVVGLQMRK